MSIEIIERSSFPVYCTICTTMHSTVVTLYIYHILTLLSTKNIHAFPKPPKGTVLLVGFSIRTKIKKCSIYAVFSPVKPPIGTVPFGGL